MQYTPYSPLALASALVALAVALYSWRRRSVTGASALVLVGSACAVWTLAYAMELETTTLSGKIFWAKLSYAGIALLPAAWLSFALQYGGRPSRFGRHLGLLLAVEPVIMLGLVASNEWHGWVWREARLESWQGFAVLSLEYGPGFWLNAAYSYALILASSGVLVPAALRAPPLYRRQAAFLVCGAMVPLVANALHVLGLQPWPHFDLTPFSLTASSLALSLGLFRFGLLDVVPIAQSAIVERLTDGVVVVDTQNRVVFMNGPAEHILGCSAAAIVGEPPPAIIVEVLRQAASLPEMHTEVPVGTGEQQRNYDIRVSQLFNRRDEETGHLIVVRDITDRKRAELDLLVARDEAVAGARLKSEFLATMSHEIRTPMNGIMGMTEILLDSGLAPEPRECAETIRCSAEGLLAIINDVLDFSKIEAGKLDLEIIDIEVRKVTEDVVALMGPRAHNKGLELACLVSERVPTAVRGDPSRIRQVLMNLVANAVKFTERGSVLVRVDSVDLNGDTPGLRFEVKDSGIGMTPDQQARLFQPFSQADGSTTRKYGGTGLGLAISKRLTELMGGTIGFESRPRNGSTFWFTVPVSPPHGAVAENAPVKPDLRPVRILIVDTHPTNRRAVEAQIKAWSGRTDVAEQGRQALALMRVAADQKHAYRVVIVDLDTLGDGALLFLNTIRAESALRNARVILLTPLGHRQDVAEFCNKQLVAATLTKPVRETRLAECLVEVLREPKEAPAQPAAPQPAAAPRQPPTAATVYPIRGHSSPPQLVVLKPAPPPATRPASQQQPQAAARPAPPVPTRPPPQPAAPPGPPPSAPAINPTVTGAPAPVNGTETARRARILVVEDNIVNQKVVVRMLGKVGRVQVDVAANGAEAVERFDNERYDLILMDCQMPVMDGFEATASIREREGRGRRTPIVALTANAMEGDRERCLAAGMDDYLAKPVRAEVLVNTVSRWLDGNVPDAAGSQASG